jgi:hypothetical protein
MEAYPHPYGHRARKCVPRGAAQVWEVAAEEHQRSECAQKAVDGVLLVFANYQGRPADGEGRIW